MESATVSWQFENFSSAKLLSPPVSPSPSMYNGLPLHQSAGTSETSSAKVPRILNNFAEPADDYFKMEMNDLGINWNEESVNLTLFEELAEIEYTPPASPKKSVVSEPAVALTSGSVALPVPVHNLGNLVSESSADISTLTAEFQAILDSLPKDSDNTEVLGQVLQIAGIPTTVINGEALVPVELDLSSDPNLQSYSMEIDDISLQAMDASESDIIDESELYGMSDISSQGSPASSIHSQYDVMVESPIDERSQAAEKILDALLLGDVATAETYLPTLADDQSSIASEDSAVHFAPARRNVTATSSIAAVVNKPERRGRKPGKKLSKGLVSGIKDKALRKKEQNKTAATRYRQKKKMEFALILESETQLQKEHDELMKKKDDLHREILMVKQLLRDVIQAKKPVGARKENVKPIVHGSGLTASSLVGRQTNRRK